MIVVLPNVSVDASTSTCVTVPLGAQAGAGSRIPATVTAVPTFRSEASVAFGLGEISTNTLLVPPAGVNRKPLT